MYAPEIVVIVAHPDDEVLWFASVLPRASAVILAFGPYAAVPEIAADRRAAVAELPYPTTLLGLDEAGTYDMTDWQNPTPSRFGVTLDHAPPDVRAAYEANFVTLRERLRPMLKPGQLVFSHNPWGEYGHPDHVLVFRAVEQLRQEIGFEHRVPAYVSARSAIFAQRSLQQLGDRSDAAAIDASFAEAIEATYQRHHCWTWDSNWVWPAAEFFYSIGDHRDGSEGALPELMMVVRAE